MEAVTKRFGDVLAVDDASFSANESEIIALLGPSGCGKTTTLRMIAGFERPDAGRIAVSGRCVDDAGVSVPPELRRVGVVFQDYALFPHLDVRRNVGFGLSREHRKTGRVAELLKMVGLSGFENRRPAELSGGQQQRVAIARALAPEPDVILLDEPFSNLDQSLRQRVRADVEAILRGAGVATVFVTHSQDEALSMADRVCVMREGRIVQTATPDDLYRRPATPFVAEFITEATIMDATLDRDGLSTPFGHIRSPIAPTQPDTPDEVRVAVRPEAVSVRVEPESPLVVSDREYYGHDQVLTITGESNTTVRCRLPAGVEIYPGTRVAVTIEINEGDLFWDQPPQ